MRSLTLALAAAGLLGAAACGQSEITENTGGATGEAAGVDATDAYSGPDVPGNQVPVTPGYQPQTAGELGGAAAGGPAQGAVSNPASAGAGTGAQTGTGSQGATAGGAETPRSGLGGRGINYPNDPNNTGVAVDSRNTPRGIEETGVVRPGTSGVGSSAPQNQP